MNLDSIEVIGIEETKREKTILACLNEVEGIKDILDKDFDEWSDFDGWENLSAQQWVFARAIDIYRGKKIDIQCDCCLLNNYQVNFANIKNQNCFGIKIAFIIANILDEIELAKEKRENNGTYSA